MLMALFQNKESLSSNKTTRVCGQADKNVQLQARPRGLIGVRRDFNLLLHPIVIRRLTKYCSKRLYFSFIYSTRISSPKIIAIVLITALVLSNSAKKVPKC